MLIKIGGFDCAEVWDGILHKNLSDYPNVSDREKPNHMPVLSKAAWTDFSVE